MEKSGDPIEKLLAKMKSTDDKLKAMEKYLKKQGLREGDAGKGRGGKGRGKKGGKGRGKKGGKGEDDKDSSDSEHEDGDDSPEAWELQAQQEHQDQHAAALAANIAPKKTPTSKFAYGTGQIVINKAGKSLDGHCFICKMKLNKTYQARPGAKRPDTRAQGKPLAGHFCLLESCPDGTEATHRALWCEAKMPFERRRLKRLELAKDFPECVLMERLDLPEDVDGEPPGLWLG